MPFFPYPPQKPLFQSWVDDSFIGKYGININNVVTGGANRLHYHDYFQIYYTVSGSCQSIGSSPNARSASFVFEKGLEPKKPRLADNGLGWGASKIK